MFATLNRRSARGKTTPAFQIRGCLVVESEFASVLKSASREGNILSPTIRQAWDTGNLTNLTKNNPVKATAAHIGIVGHITESEMRTILARGGDFQRAGKSLSLAMREKVEGFAGRRADSRKEPYPFNR